MKGLFSTSQWCLLIALLVSLLFERLPRMSAHSRRLLLRRRRPTYELMTNDKPTQAPCEAALMTFIALSPTAQGSSAFAGYFLSFGGVLFCAACLFVVRNCNGRRGLFARYRQMNELNRQVEVEAEVIPAEDSIAQADARYVNADEVIAEERKEDGGEAVDVEASVVPEPIAQPALTTARPLR